MFDTTMHPGAPHASHGAHAAGHAAAGLQARVGYNGPERRSGSSLLTRWLAQMIDEIDYGMLLLSADAQLLHANHAARAELDAGHPLQLLGRTLRARLAQDVAPLHDALAAAQRGLRRLLTVGGGTQRVSVAVVPLGALGDAGDRAATLVVLSKRELCEALSVHWYARAHGLTQAETRVLEGLCRGLQPREIAQAHGVELSTVRTQVGQIRAKTGADSIRGLVAQVARLPPLLSALRGGASGAADHGGGGLAALARAA
jgi:DNA-binding CsgD family transcriptional regulator